jgi:hypothetical protein
VLLVVTAIGMTLSLVLRSIPMSTSVFGMIGAWMWCVVARRSVVRPLASTAMHFLAWRRPVVVSGSIRRTQP